MSEATVTTTNWVKVTMAAVDLKHVLAALSLLVENGVPPTAEIRIEPRWSGEERVIASWAEPSQPLEFIKHLVESRGVSEAPRERRSTDWGAGAAPLQSPSPTVATSGDGQ